VRSDAVIGWPGNGRGLTMGKPKVFIGSSELNVKVARAIADELGDYAEVTVWNEDVFAPSDSFLERLMATPNRFDFAVMVWAPDDMTASKGQSEASPRDNVIFECGLFMGVLGLNRVFVVQDAEVMTKIPSDFSGTTLASYDGTRIVADPRAAVRSACDQLKRAMSDATLADLGGEWRERYMEFGAISPTRLEEDIEVAIFADTVSLVRCNEPGKAVVFEARGRPKGNRVRGEWHHTMSASFARGPFLLVLDTAGDVMYGYSGAYDPDGGAVFEAWILAKKTGRTDAKIAELLAWGEETLKRRTIGLGLTAVAAQIQ
jgi:hypothetical protein